MLKLDPPNKLLVLAEYESSGIWLKQSDGVEEVKYEALVLPEDLRKRFQDWIVLYSDRLTDNAIPLDHFNDLGRNLAQDLKNFVGPDVIVAFIPELVGDNEGSPEVID